MPSVRPGVKLNILDTQGAFTYGRITGKPVLIGCFTDPLNGLNETPVYI